MTANVRCAGGGAWLRDHGHVVKPMDTAQRLHLSTASPCGWKGERFANGQRIGVLYFRWDEEDRKARTRKPCPWCGGQVELIA
jgi:hypothetical protein